jgi:hypothetical protein
MGLFSRFSKAKYDDAQIATVATRAIEEDPVIDNPGQVVVTSKNGIVKLSGTVHSDVQLHHVEGTVNSALKVAGLKRAEIANEIIVGR